MADFLAYMFIKAVSGVVWTVLLVFGLFLVRRLWWVVCRGREEVRRWKSR